MVAKIGILARKFRQLGAFRIELAKLIPSDGATRGWFGFNQVAIDGGVLAIGALGDDEQATNSGAVYVFH